MKIIGHIDLDYFFAQVEEIERPSLKGKPIIICVFSGRAENSGVVSTANYTARSLGIKSGMPISLAKKRLVGIEAHFIPVQLEKYKAISEKIMQIIKSRVDTLETIGIDEAFFDITDTSNGDYARAKLIAEDIKKEIMSKESLTCSIGIAPNKVIAKIASEISKPNGLLIVTPDQVDEFLDPLPVERLFRVGPKTAKALKEINVNVVKDLRAIDFEKLRDKIGNKLALYLFNIINGTYHEPVIERRQTQQLSRIVTLRRDTRDTSEIFNQLKVAIQDLHNRLMLRKYLFRTITVMLVLSDLSVKTKAKTFEWPINDLGTIMAQVNSLLSDQMNFIDKDVRRAGIRISDLVSNEDQTSLTQYIP